MEQRPYAAFDIDGTVIRWQLYHALNDALVKRNIIDKNAFTTVREARMDWKRRSGDNAFSTYEMEMVRVFDEHLPTLHYDRVQEAANAVIDEYKDQVYTYTRDLIKDLKSKGYLLFAVSGSPKFIVEPLAEYYGFDDTVGTYYSVEGGIFTGEKDLSLGRKPELIRELIAKHQAISDGSVAVGDSSGDSGMLGMVEQPVAFNPDKKLFHNAQKQGWKIVVERKNMVYKMEPHGRSYILA